jgi:hypothetical protein
MSDQFKQIMIIIFFKKNKQNTIATTGIEHREMRILPAPCIRRLTKNGAVSSRINLEQCWSTDYSQSLCVNCIRWICEQPKKKRRNPRRKITTIIFVENKSIGDYRCVREVSLDNEGMLPENALIFKSLQHNTQTNQYIKYINTVLYGDANNEKLIH